MVANLEELKALPTAEKIELIDELWDSIDDAKMQSISDKELAELDRRCEELEMHPETGVSLEQVIANARVHRAY